ncbi:MAG: CPBP family glutamic-type intramembrane protease [Erythrobacter sp.]
MSTETTSLVPVNSFPEQWRHFAGFLRRPELPAQTGSFQQGLKAIFRMLVLDLAIMIMLLSVVLLVVLVGVELPKNAISDLELNLPVILGIVIAAPVLEELAFRGWLSGKPGHVLALAILIVGLGGATVLSIGDNSPAPAAILSIAAMIAALAALIFLRKRPPMQWFSRLFPAFFWLSALGFALIHIFNYQEGDWYALLPLVVPQLVLGSVCAYLRVHNGLWSAMLMHALHNGIIVACVMTALQFAE